MKSFFAIAVALLFVCSSIFAANSEEIYYGKNLLRQNPNVKVYRENALGIPEHVEGNLATAARSSEQVSVALQFFEDNRGAYKMASPSEELTAKKTETDKLGMNHIRFDQYYKGVRVIGGELVAHFKADGQLRTVNGNYEAYINLDATPSLTSARATDIAGSDLRETFGEGNPQNQELVIFPWQGTFYLCWRMFLMSDTPMGRWEYFIDATNGDVVFKANRIMDSDEIGTGVGVMGDTRDHVDTELDASVYYMTDNTRQAANDIHGHGGLMPPGSNIQTSLATTTLPGTVATDADNVWDDPNIQSPAVDGHVYTGLVYDWWLTTFGRNSYNDAGASMRVSVNYSAEGTENAYWNGSRIVVWSWSAGYNSLAGCPDVIAHEWGHAITDLESNLVYQYEPGALNESFSDMMGAAFEFAYPDYDTPDWLMAENITDAGTDAFRDMENPHLGNQPDYYGITDVYWYDLDGCTPSSSTDYCGVHYNSGVGNKWFYLLSEGGVHHGVTVEAIGWQAAIQIAYRANCFYWTSSSDYHSAALGTLTAADDLDGTGLWREQALKAWHAVGVFPTTALLEFSYPGGIPDQIYPEQEATFLVDVSATNGGSVVSGSGRVFTSVNGGAWTETALTEVATNQYEVVLPATLCEGIIQYYIAVDEATNGTFYNPDPSLPLQAVAITGTTYIFNDDFETDKGWTITGDAVAGMWERGVPVDWDRGDPPTDFDGSGSCFLTDNDPTQNNSDVDDGFTAITSPTFDLSSGDAYVHYARWLSNNLGSNAYMEPLLVYISNDNGSNWVLAETVGPTGVVAAGGWFEHTFLVSDFVTPTDQMMVQFYVADLTGSIVEAAIDDFQVVRYNCGLNIVTEVMPDWTVGRPYSQQIIAPGGVGTVVFTDKYGDLSGTDFTLSSSGLLTGTPMTTGPVSYTAYAVDDELHEDEQLITFTVYDALEITTTTVPEWTMNRAYPATAFTSTGGKGTITWMDMNGDLSSTGMTLGPDGSLTGTATVSGDLVFTAQASDETGDVKTQPITLTINPALAVTSPSTIPDAFDTKPYSYQFTSSGGTAPITWVDLNDDLAGTGLSISTTGLLSGTPTVGVTSLVFRAQAEDATGSTKYRLTTLHINEPYVCGDVDDTPPVNILDAVYLINYIYKSGTAPNYLISANVNYDQIPTSAIDILDIVRLINFLYKGGNDPVCGGY